ncbi:MAG: hypothetical protein P4L84_14685 [Isosphaeraceae bacterium]|nr:hypothetical protein [Isosphaeraceae bacterium]
MDDRKHYPGPLPEWKSLLVADLERVALRDRWGLGLIVVGWSHLAFFLLEQGLFSAQLVSRPLFVALWAAELFVNIFLFGRVVGKGWSRSTPLAGIMVRLWATFLILSFNVASLNTMTGWALDWFKPVWATLSTFGFMMMAYLINPRYFFLAVQMYFTGLLMALFPAWNYLIYGVSWWAALEGVGLILERRRGRRAVGAGEPVTAETASAAA